MALGGNALLRRGEPPSAENQRRNVRTAVAALAPLTRDHQLVVSHGNGPQVGLLALQSVAARPEEAYPLDILDAETEGMIGYLIEQELRNLLPPDQRYATLLTQIEVDPADPAFGNPTKPIGPIYPRARGHRIAAERGWVMAADGGHLRRVVPSPKPLRIFELNVIELLVAQGVIVICAGGGGIPTIRLRDGSLAGVEAVIDKDAASSLLARELKARAFLMLTDVDGVYLGWGTSTARRIRRAAPSALGRFAFEPGSMGPKVIAACEFVAETGGVAGVGRLDDAVAILQQRAGTLISADYEGLSCWD